MQPAATSRNLPGRGWLLKACIFATGMSGIVAEYVMSTLAGYLLGNEVVQFALVISVMLFAMGLGSRFSRRINHNLLDSFIVLELTLALLCASSALTVYALAFSYAFVGVVIYAYAFAIGLLIGLEIPLVTRINERYQELRVNVSSVMEHDYYGSLLGGLLFAFVALPHLGLTYTPIVLGAVDGLIAVVLFFRYRSVFRYRRALSVAVVATPLILGSFALSARPIVMYGEQRGYRDPIVYAEQSRYQKLVMTEWRGDHWFYLDGSLQFSTFDEVRYHEPLVHPAMQLAAAHGRVLLLGAGDGLAAREVLKYDDVESVTLVDLDPAVTNLARSHPVLREQNGGSLDDPRVEVLNGDAYSYLRNSSELFDVIIADFPDPKSISLARLYSVQFYRLVNRHLGPGGVFVTQATSPFFSQQAFLSILKTVRAAGFTSVPYRNHVPTLGEWGFVLGVKPATDRQLDSGTLKAVLERQTFPGVETQFLNPDAMMHMLNFGKDELAGLTEVAVSSELNHAVADLYRFGRWDLN